MTVQFTSKFTFGERVHIDLDKSLVGRVAGFCWKCGEGHTVEVQWIHNGTPQSAWMPPGRLTAAE